MPLSWFSDRWLPASATPWQKTNGTLVSNLPNYLTDVQVDEAAYKTSDKLGYITWPNTEINGLQQFQLWLAGNSQPGEVIVQYCTAVYPYFDDDLIHSRSHRPIVQKSGQYQRLTWYLPQAAWSVRLLLPANASFQIEAIEAFGIDPQRSEWHTWRQAIILALYVCSLVSLLVWLSSYLSILKALLRLPLSLVLFAVLAQGLVMIVLLPPFQGPDENRHWKTAVELFRLDGRAGSVLQNLPAILDAETPRLRSERPFAASRLYTSAVPETLTQEQIKVTYTKHWGYPTVGVVSLLFPPVTTVSEAIVFYYCCRLVHLLCLLLLVAYAWKLGLGSCTLLVFMLMPLVLQQCLIISTDIAHNLGTFLAILLWVQHHRQRRQWSLIWLVIVCGIVVAAKPPIYMGVLLLLAWFLPWRRLLRPLPLVVLGIGLAITLTAVIWYLWGIVDDSRMQMGQEARQQLKYILTGEGLQQFIQATMEYPTRFLMPHHWFGPLGWLDTLVSPVHQHLLWIGFILAVIVDGLCLIARLFRMGFWSLLDILEPFVGSIAHAVFIWWSLALVMYLTITPYKCDSIVGMQVRYMVPAMFFLLLWPAGSWQPQNFSPLPRGSQRGFYQLATLILVILAMVRCIFLARDLFFRYWS